MIAGKFRVRVCSSLSMRCSVGEDFARELTTTRMNDTFREGDHSFLRNADGPARPSGL